MKSRAISSVLDSIVVRGVLLTVFTAAIFLLSNSAAAATVSGYVYNDTNTNGVFDSGEGPVTAQTYVKLISSGVVLQVSTTSLSTGLYSFSGVPAGTYTIVVANNSSTTDTTASPPSNWRFRNPANGSTDITVSTTDMQTDFGLVAGNVCVCGYGDGRPTQASITLDGDISDWADTIADPDNNSCDTTGIADRDYPIQSTGRDLLQFAVTWDNTRYYGLTIRAASDNNIDNFVYYADTSNDGKMQTGEPVVVARWRGSNRNVDLSIGTYSAVNAGGDPMLSSSGYADGYTLPGNVVDLVSKGTFRWGGGDGVSMEWGVLWSDLGVPPGSAIHWHVSSTNTNPGSGSFPGQTDDNLGGCGGRCSGSNEYADLTFTGANSTSAAPPATVYFPHTITNLGNATDRFNFRTQISGVLTSATVRYYKDNGTSGVYEPGVDTLLTDSDTDSLIDTGPIAMGASINVFVAVDIPAGTSTGTLTVTTTATSSFIPCGLTGSPATKTVTDNVGIGGSVSGFVYSDANHSDNMDNGETGTGQILYMKLMPSSAPSGPATLVVAVNSTTGAYTLVGVAAGSYIVLVDNNNTASDVTPTIPAGWMALENASLKINITVNNSGLSNLNFGLFNGTKVSGTVFKDDGAGSGTANNGVQDGGEIGLSSVAVKATDSSSTTYDQTTTDGSGKYTLWLPAAASAVRVVETNSTGYVSTGASVGNSGGTYSRATDTISFTNTGVVYTGLNFGEVLNGTLSPNGALQTLPNTSVFYPHSFLATTTGQITLTATDVASPNIGGYSETLFRDTNCNGQLDAGEPQITGAISVTAGTTVCLLVKSYVPGAAPFNATDSITVTAALVLTNASPALTLTYTATDVTTVGAPKNAGLRLEKVVDKAAAISGTVITYTVTYINDSSGALSNIVINDSTPAYTTFQSAACGAPLPTGVTACTVSTQPAAGAAGPIQWTLTGSMNSAQTGTVTYSVKVN